MAKPASEDLRSCRAHDTFKSYRINRIYNLNADECHHKVVIMSGKLVVLGGLSYAASVLTVNLLKLMKN